MRGRYITLEALDPAMHGESLWAKLGGQQNSSLWVYVFDGPYLDRAEFDRELKRKAASQDYLFFAVVDNESELRARFGGLSQHPSGPSVD